jgi:hypothetical protein
MMKDFRRENKIFVPPRRYRNEVEVITPKMMKAKCSVEIFSLTPRFNAVNGRTKKRNRLNGFPSRRLFYTQLKQGVNEKFSTKRRQSKKMKKLRNSNVERKPFPQRHRHFQFLRA